jgi:oligopeptide/dipeptide ABC transporter ATP-binding protein
MSTAPLLRIRGLAVEFPTPRGPFRAVDGVDLDVRPGETLGVVGESGSGKTLTLLAALRLAPEQARVVAGDVEIAGRDALSLGARELRRLRGKVVSFVFQDALNALNPVVTIGTQLAEGMRSHDRSVSRRAARLRACALLERVGVSDPRRRLSQYPHELSGGMRQRVLIAMAIANEPRLVIADEPTTALDVTIQAQVLELLRDVTRANDMALVLVTHDLGVVAEIADRVAVMYAGRVVEHGAVEAIFHRPGHPYTAALLASRPRIEGPRTLSAIPGQPPAPGPRPSGCSYAPRCALRGGRKLCLESEPPTLPRGDGHEAACHFTDELGVDGRLDAGAVGA